MTLLPSPDEPSLQFRRNVFFPKRRELQVRRESWQSTQPRLSSLPFSLHALPRLAEQSSATLAHRSTMRRSCGCSMRRPRATC